jgi:hypothetical protein
MNRPMPRGDFRHRSADPSRPSRSARALPGAVRLVCGVAADRREAMTCALNAKKHGGFERGRTNPALRKPVAPLETLCATGVRTEEMVGQCS